MKEFKRKVDDELSQPYHNKKKLQFLCFVCVSFVVDTKNPLKTPSWLMVLNISALDYLNDIMGKIFACTLRVEQSVYRSNLCRITFTNMIRLAVQLLRKDEKKRQK